jgi:serine/threonine protein kinase
MDPADIARADIDTMLNIGSLRYEAPELLDYRTEQYQPSRTDVWSLGIILLNLLRGKSPWQEANNNDPVFRRYQRGEIGVIKNAFKLTEQGWYIACRMLQLDPQDRASVGEVAELIETYQDVPWVTDVAPRREHAYFMGPQLSDNAIIDRFANNTPRNARPRKREGSSGMGPRALSWASEVGEANFDDMPLFHLESDEEGSSPVRATGAKWDDDEDDFPEPGSQSSMRDSDQTAVDGLDTLSLEAHDHERAMFNRIEIGRLK